MNRKSASRIAGESVGDYSPDQKDHIVDDSLMTVPDVAQFLKVPISRIYNLLFKRELPCIKIGRSVRFKRKDIEEWVNKRYK